MDLLFESILAWWPPDVVAQLTFISLPRQLRLFMADRAEAAECDSLNSTNAYGSFPGYFC